MGTFKDEVNKAVEEAKEILSSKTTEDIKSSTKEAVDEAKEIVDNLEQKGIKKKLSFLSWYGRLNRSSFFVQAICVQIIFLFCCYIIYKLNFFINTNLLLWIVMAFFSYLYFIIINKRFHDLGKSYEYSLGVILSVFISFYMSLHNSYIFFVYNAIVIFAMNLKSGEDKENLYGTPENGVKIGKYIIYEGDILKGFEGWCKKFNDKIKKNIINNKLCKSMFINKKNVLAVGVSLIVLLCGGYYLYIPKMSDVEKYQQEKNVAGMCELIDKTLKPLEGDDGVDKYRDIRSSAISALVEMRVPEGIEFLENKVLDENIWDYQIKSEIIKALVQADNKYIEKICNKYIDLANKQNGFDEKTKIYDELYRFSITGVSEDYISATIYKDALKSLNNNTANDIKVCKYVNQKVFPATNYSFSNKLIFDEYSKLVNLFSEGYEDSITQQIDGEIAEAQETIKSLNYYFSSERQELSRYRAQQIYAEEGERAALKYIQDEHKTLEENQRKLWGAWDKINKLNNRKNHIPEERAKALKEKNRLYNILHSWAARKEFEVFHNTRNNANTKHEIMPLGYKIGVKYDDIKQDINVQHRGRYEIYTINNNDKNIYSDFVPVEKVSILNTELLFDKTRDKKLKMVEVLVNGKKEEIVNYLDNLYGDRLYSHDEGDRYLQVRWGDEENIVVYTYIHNVGKDTNSIRIGDRKWFESQP